MEDTMRNIDYEAIKVTTDAIGRAVYNMTRGTYAVRSKILDIFDMPEGADYGGVHCTFDEKYNTLSIENVTDENGFICGYDVIAVINRTVYACYMPANMLKQYYKSIRAEFDKEV
jgi:hypothetical protein